PFYTSLEGTAQAERFEKSSALGIPIGRDDLFAKGLSLYAQAGFTTGIISSIVSEEIALGAADALTRKLSTPATIAIRQARRTKNIAHLKDAFKIGDRIADIDKTRKAYKTAIEVLDQNKN